MVMSGCEIRFIVRLLCQTWCAVGLWGVGEGCMDLCYEVILSNAISVTKGCECQISTKKHYVTLVWPLRLYFTCLVIDSI